MKKELKRPFFGRGGVSLISYFSTDKTLGTEYGIHLSCAMIADHVTLLTIFSLGKCTFRFSGSVLFNSLPTHIKNTSSLSSFKSRVRCHFEKIFFSFFIILKIVE